MKKIVALSVLSALSLLGCKKRLNNESVTESQPGVSRDPNPRVASSVLYEVQVRAANACDPNEGSGAQRSACASKIAPKVTYRAEGKSCGDLSNLHRIKLGTLDDMFENTADYTQGITLRYINEKVGANTVWVMPLFPNNDIWDIPSGCDNIGSPYAVRDYMHVAGTHARSCIKAGRDEYSNEPCWGNDTFDKFVAEAHKRGMSVMLDLAFNHFGHNYLMYDYVDFTPVRERIARGENLSVLSNFSSTYEAFVEKPQLLDTASKLDELAKKNPWHKAQLDGLMARCPNLQGDLLVRYYNMWRDALDWERANFQCAGKDPRQNGAASYLEKNLPGFYTGRNKFDPSKNLEDKAHIDDWVDVKFLFLHDEHRMAQHEYIRNREYLFRVMNYWASRGVDAFRLDHTTDKISGIDSNDWAYIISKVSYYAQRRGQKRPFFMAEEFHDQGNMRRVVDTMTEGFVFDLRKGDPKDSGRVEWVINNMKRHNGEVTVMTALETHDEKRLLEKNGDHATGFGPWTGAGFWAIGATQWSTPMILMGQEFGEPWGLGFRKSDFIRGRFQGNPNFNPEGQALVGYYNALIKARLSNENRALRSKNFAFLRNKQNKANPDIFAQVKWSDDANVVFTFHNLWEKDVSDQYFIAPDLASRLSISEGTQYRLQDALSNKTYLDCRSGKDLKWELPVQMERGTRVLWLRLEACR